MMQRQDDVPGPFLNELERFYRRVDLDACLIYKLDPDRFHCGTGCHDCCIDGLSVFEIEAAYIARHHRHLLVQQKPHPEGRCPFLNAAGACVIYQYRPYVCRTQGLPLRWIDDPQDGGAVEIRDICPLNDKGQPLETLPPEACWTIGPFEEDLARLQIAAMGRSLKRIRLRDLFLREM
jgi:hypothetical protein